MVKTLKVLGMCWNPVPADIAATGKFWYRPDFTVSVLNFGNRQFFNLTAL
jgi:hypothetical protein